MEIVLLDFGHVEIRPGIARESNRVWGQAFSTYAPRNSNSSELIKQLCEDAKPGCLALFDRVWFQEDDFEYY